MPISAEESSYNRGAMDSTLFYSPSDHPQLSESDNMAVSFHYQRSSNNYNNQIDGQNPQMETPRSPFLCLSVAALGANTTLANTRCACSNGWFCADLLPGLGSPAAFRRFSSSDPSLPVLRTAASTPPVLSHNSLNSFLHVDDAQTAGGAAGEDRVQAVLSEESGVLFCAVYDGFSGRDAADFLAGTFYPRLLTSLVEQQQQQQIPHGDPRDYIHHEVLQALQTGLAEIEAEFLHMAQQELNQRPDLVMVGSCVLILLLHGHDLYTMNLGNSRAVLATSTMGSNGGTSLLLSQQLTEDHSIDNNVERERVIAEHPDDPSTVLSGRVKGILNLTRAFGAGYLKNAALNNALMGILQVQDLCSPPYISTEPFVRVHTVSQADRLVVMGSDGLFDFFTNQEVVEFVDRFISENPASDPAKYMIDKLLSRAAIKAGMTVEDLKTVPTERRRKYHDDVTIIVIILSATGAAYQNSWASTL